MKLQVFPLGNFQANSVILSHEGSAVVFDAGDRADLIIKYLTAENLTIKRLVATHAHFDHVSGFYPIQKKYDALMPLHIHKLDAELLKEAPKYAEIYGYTGTEPITSVSFIDAGDTIDFDIQVLHTPGHTAGSLCFYLKNYEDGLVITGDTLFAGSVGRTDLPGALPNELSNSIKEKLFSLPDKTVVLAGHGELSTIGVEKATNPYVK